MEILAAVGTLMALLMTAALAALKSLDLGE